MGVLTLVGMMGAGKTTVSRVVASRRGWSVCDLDDLIVARAGESVSAIFAREGQAGFRRRERDALAEALTSRTPLVLATGGGAPAQPGAMDAITEAGPSVWLRCAPQLAARRALAQGGRPLLEGCADHAEVVALMTAMAAERRPFYARASIVVDVTASDTPDAIADRIEAGL